MTKEIYLEDPYLKFCKAKIISKTHDGIILDQTVFYPEGGGQPGDVGHLKTESGEKFIVTNTKRINRSGQPIHFVEHEARLKVGDKVIAEIDWLSRYTHMRMHSALHLLCSLVDGRVTGGQINTKKSRLDFDLKNTKLDKLFIEEAINSLVKKNYLLNTSWITNDALKENQHLIRTMSVCPPEDANKIRLVEIIGVDWQPCGGTHVNKTSEIGRIRIGKIENKGKHNRRINLHLMEI